MAGVLFRWKTRVTVNFTICEIFSSGRNNLLDNRRRKKMFGNSPISRIVSLFDRNRMQDLIELTSAIHYEAFRRRRLMETNGMIDMCSLNESHIWCTQFNKQNNFYYFFLFPIVCLLAVTPFLTSIKIRRFEWITFRVIQTRTLSWIELGKILSSSIRWRKDGRVAGRRFRSNGRPDWVYFFSVFRASANKTFGIRPSAPSKRLFIIESEANLLQLFIPQWKTSAQLPKHESDVESVGMERTNHATSQCPLLIWMYMRLTVSVECSKKSSKLLKFLYFYIPDVGFSTSFPLTVTTTL